MVSVVLGESRWICNVETFCLYNFVSIMKKVEQIFGCYSSSSYFSLKNQQMVSELLDLRRDWVLT